MKLLTPERMAILKRYGPLAIGVGLLGYIVGSTPWPEVARSLSEIGIWSALALLGLSVTYFTAKSTRFWYMLRPIGVGQPLGVVVMVYMAAQPASLLPAGELFRNRTLERYTGVPMSKSSPTFLMQGASEGLVICALAIVAGLTSGGVALLITSAVGVVLVALLLLLANPRLARSNTFVGALNAIPFVALRKRSLQEFNRQNRALLAPRSFSIILGLTLVAELAGVAIIALAVTQLGASISFAAAVIAYGLPVIVSFLSFLPGGIGAADQTSISTLRAAGVEQGQAVAATIVSRFSIVVFGVLVGFAMQFIIKRVLRDRLERYGGPTANKLPA